MDGFKHSKHETKIFLFSRSDGVRPRPTREELLGGGGDLGLLGDAVGVVGAAGAPGGAEAGDLLHSLGERGNLQSPQHVHWV